MPAPAVTPAETPKQSPPQYKILSRPTSSGGVSSQTNLDLSEFETPREQSKSNPPLNSFGAEVSRMALPENTASANSKPESILSMVSSGYREAGVSASKGANKSAAPKPNSRNRATTSTPKAKKLNAPRSNSQPKLQTPVRKNVTPSQAYAGPTFHASPAASSLPIPKFFSKSVPEPQKPSSLNAMKMRDVNGTPLYQANESPTLRKSKVADENQAKRELPLDSFFQADREGKLSNWKEDDMIAQAEDQGSTLASSAGFTITPSSSLSSVGRPAYHTRHTTNGSVGGMFPLEIDDSISPPLKNELSPTARDFSPQPRTRPSVTSRPNTAPANVATQLALDEQQRKAKSLELKKLLLSPVPQHPLSTNTQSPTNLSVDGATRVSSLIRSASGPSKLDLGCGTSYVNQDQKPCLSSQSLRYSSATVSPSNGSPRPRPNSYSLRKQVVIPNSSKYFNLPELPTSLPPTPAPPRSYNSYDSSEFLNQRNHSYKSTISPAASAQVSQGPFQGIEQKALQDPDQARLIEDYLRRVVLKLDILGGDSATAVHS